MLRFITAGSVDDGKSTLIGRLLYEANGVYEDQFESLRQVAAQRRSSVDLSLLTDGLKAEREQAITIDVAYRYFCSTTRKFIIADTPGHEQYTRNMVTGASTADLAIILVDARKGVLEQTCRHAYIARLLGIRRIVLAVNKMDAVGFDESVFRRACQMFNDFAALIKDVEHYFVPISAREGDNVVHKSARMPWYEGPALLQLLEDLPLEEGRNLQDFRFPVQRVLRPNQDFRGYAGQISSGVIRLEEEVVALPSGRRTTVHQIRLHDKKLEEAFAPQSVLLTLTDHIDLGRGDMLANPESVPSMSNALIADVIWMSERPLRLNLRYLVKHTAQTLYCNVITIFHRVDIHTLEEIQCGTLALNEIGRVEIRTHKPLFFDAYVHNRVTGSFILIDPDTNDTVAAGMITSSKPHNATTLMAANHQNGEDRQPTIAVDVDGVLADYDGWKGIDVLGEPRADVVQVLRVLRTEGWKIVIHTTQSDEHITGYLIRHQIPYDEINKNSSYRNPGSKPVATVYWDDRAVCYSGDALRDLEAIRQFRTWSGRR